MDLYELAQLVIDNAPHINTPSSKLTTAERYAKFSMHVTGANIFYIADGVMDGEKPHFVDPTRFSEMGINHYLDFIDGERTVSLEQTHFDWYKLDWDQLNDYESNCMDF